jgi:hypothetical protein
VWLRKLQEFAAENEVTVGLKGLVALAECADPSVSIHQSSNLSRIFKQFGS